MSSLTPDREMLAQFAGLMFKHARPDGFVSLRAFPDKSKEKKEKPIFVDPIRVGDRDFLDIADRTRAPGGGMARSRRLLPADRDVP